MSDDNIQRLYDKLEKILVRLTRVEENTQAPIDVSRLRWDGKALNYVIVRVIAPILITVMLGGSAFYYGLHCEIDDLSYQVTQHVEQHK